MKIITISTLATGGAAIAAKNLHNAFLDEGHNGLFLTLAAPEDLPLSASISGEGPLETARWMREVFSYWASLCSQGKIEEHCCDLFSDATSAFYDIVPEDFFADADVVHIHWGAGILFSPFFFKCLEGKKVVFTLHDFNPFTGGCHYTKHCDLYTRKCGDCPVLLRASSSDLSSTNFALKKALYASLKPAIIAPSQWLLNIAGESSLLASRPKCRIPNAHPLDFYRPLNRDVIRAQYGISASDFVLLCGAEYAQNVRKGIKLFEKLIALASNHEVLNNIKVVVFGSGKFDIPGVEHLGMVTQEELCKLYNVADVFVHPALLDNLSNTLCEAQCCGTPVVAFDVGGNAEAFVHGKSGVLAKEQTVEALLAAVQQVYALDEGARLSMRTAARSYAETTFSPRIVAQSHIKFYEELLLSPENVSANAELCNLLAMQNIVGISKIMGNLFVDKERLYSEVANICNDSDLLRDKIAQLQKKVDQLSQEVVDIKKK